jgi:hypothetical protein
MSIRKREESSIDKSSKIKKKPYNLHSYVPSASGVMLNRASFKEVNQQNIANAVAVKRRFSNKLELEIEIFSKNSRN